MCNVHGGPPCVVLRVNDDVREGELFNTEQVDGSGVKWMKHLKCSIEVSTVVSKIILCLAVC